MSNNSYISSLTKTEILEKIEQYRTVSQSNRFSFDYDVQLIDGGFTVENKNYASRYGLLRVKLVYTFLDDSIHPNIKLKAKPFLPHLAFFAVLIIFFCGIIMTRDVITLNGVSRNIDTAFKVKWSLILSFGFSLLAFLMTFASIKLLSYWTKKKLNLKKSS